MKPDISIVIPLYNKERYIQRAIDSVLRQTIQNFECVIIDSSTDGSTALVTQNDDPRIVHVIFEKSTAARARNQGVQIAQSDLVAFLDADDEWQPDHLETLINLRKKFPDAGLYATSHVKIRTDGRPMVMIFYGIPRPPWEGYIPDYLRICSQGDEPVHSSSCAVPRDILASMGGFSDGVMYGEDQLLWGKISLVYLVAFSWKGLTIYHTEALGRICDETHVIREHPFSTYLRQELATGTIPPEKLGGCRAYIRRKWYAEVLSKFISDGRSASCENTNGPVADNSRLSGSEDKRFSGSMNIVGRTLIRLYNSSVHDAVRRCLCWICGFYNPGNDLDRDRGK
jgi:glycosyltransferase involved in cell wall biosynthesis